MKKYLFVTQATNKVTLAILAAAKACNGKATEVALASDMRECHGKSEPAR